MEIVLIIIGIFVLVGICNAAEDSRKANSPAMKEMRAQEEAARIARIRDNHFSGRKAQGELDRLKLGKGRIEQAIVGLKAMQAPKNVKSYKEKKEGRIYTVYHIRVGGMDYAGFTGQKFENRIIQHLTTGKTRVQQELAKNNYQFAVISLDTYANKVEALMAERKKIAELPVNRLNDTAGGEGGDITVFTQVNKEKNTVTDYYNQTKYMKQQVVQLTENGQGMGQVTMGYNGHVSAYVVNGGIHGKKPEVMKELKELLMVQEQKIKEKTAERNKLVREYKKK